MLDLLEQVATAQGFSMDTPVEKLSSEQLQVFLYGSEKWIDDHRVPGLSFQYRGIFPTVELVARYANRFPELSRLLHPTSCSACSGGRLRAESLSVLIEGVSIADLCGMSIEHAMKFIDGIDLSDTQTKIVGELSLIHI